MNIYIVDAFTDVPYKGNPAAVCVLDCEQSDKWMQQVANEMNLSEIVFLCKEKSRLIELSSWHLWWES